MAWMFAGKERGVEHVARQATPGWSTRPECCFRPLAENISQRVAACTRIKSSHRSESPASLGACGQWPQTALGSSAPPERRSDEHRVANASGNCQLPRMSAVEIIEQIKNLPVAERAQVARFIVEQDDSWIADEFKQAMADADAGRFVEMDSIFRNVPEKHE